MDHINVLSIQLWVEVLRQKWKYNDFVNRLDCCVHIETFFDYLMQNDLVTERPDAVNFYRYLDDFSVERSYLSQDEVDTMINAIKNRE